MVAGDEWRPLPFFGLRLKRRDNLHMRGQLICMMSPNWINRRMIESHRLVICIALSLHAVVFFVRRMNEKQETPVRHLHLHVRVIDQ